MNINQMTPGQLAQLAMHDDDWLKDIVLMANLRGKVQVVRASGASWETLPGAARFFRLMAMLQIVFLVTCLALLVSVLLAVTTGQFWMPVLLAILTLGNLRKIYGQLCEMRQVLMTSIKCLGAIELVMNTPSPRARVASKLWAQVRQSEVK